MTRSDSVHEAVTIRTATLADVPSIHALIATSARALGASDYTSEQIEAALLGAWGVDTEIIRDGTYFLGFEEELVLCGGWSRRATLFGGDAYDRRESRLLDPETEPARIRAFFVHPHWARRGLASRLLVLCEHEAKAAGFAAVTTSRTPGSRRTYFIRSKPSPSAPAQTHVSTAQPIRTRRSQSGVIP